MLAEAVVDPGAMVIAFTDTDTTKGAVFAAGGFVEATCAADFVGSVEDVVVRVETDGCVVGGDGNGGRAVCA